MTHGDAREREWRGNWRMEWVATTLHTTSEHGVSSITTSDAHNSAASSRQKWSPCRFKLTRPFRRKTKSSFCACAITFQTQSTACLPHVVGPDCLILDKGTDRLSRRAVFLNRRTAVRYRTLASIIPDREIFSWKLSF